MRIELNIGLYVNGKDDGKTIERASEAVRLVNLHSLDLQARLAPSVTEPTLVLKCDLLGALALDIIAERLEQDCIAIRYENGKGELIGPKAEAWGEFNPEYFIRF